MASSVFKRRATSDLTTASSSSLLNGPRHAVKLEFDVVSELCALIIGGVDMFSQTSTSSSISCRQTCISRLLIEVAQHQFAKIVDSSPTIIVFVDADILLFPLASMSIWSGCTKGTAGGVCRRLVRSSAILRCQQISAR